MNQHIVKSQWLSVPDSTEPPVEVLGERWVEVRWQSVAAAPLVLGRTDAGTVIPFVLRRGARRQFLRLPAEVTSLSLNDVSPPSGLRFRASTAFHAYLSVLAEQIRTGRFIMRCGTAMQLVASGALTEVWRRVLRSAEPTPFLKEMPCSLRPSKNVARSKLPLRAAFFSHSMALQGAPLSLLDLAIGLRDDGVVDPVFVGAEPGPLAHRVRDVHIQPIMSPMSSAARLTANNLRVHIQHTAALLNAEAISFVYANTLHSFPAILAAEECGIPCVWMIRESDPWWAAFDDYGTEVRSLAMQACVRADRVVFVADATRRLWQDRIPAERVTTIPNQLRIDPALTAPSKIDARTRLGVSHDELIILNVGELSSVKGQADLIEAFARVPSEYVEFSRLIFLGNGRPTERKRIEAKLARLSPERRERVRIDPASLDASVYFAAADIYVLASHSESYPRVILEAMAHRLAILATAVYGVTEQIREGINGYLVGIGDIDALVARLTRLLSDPYERQRLGSSARRTHEERAGFGAVIASHSTLIEEILIERSPA